MFATLNRSLDLAKTTFRVMKQDPEMILFPLIGAVASIAYSALLLAPTFFLDTMAAQTSGAEGTAFGALQYLALFVTYFGLAFIATFSNVCVVYIAKERFDGGDATFGDAVRFAVSRIHQIVLWSALAASVGFILARLDHMADNAKGIAGVVLRGLRGAIGFAWSVVTLFVVPAMVYEGVGPIDALKSSATTLKQTWGESLTRHVGFGFISFLLWLPGIAGIIAGIAAISISGILGGLLIAGAVVYLILVTMAMSVANAVFNTALYHYARRGQVVSGYDQATLQAVFG
ncbi:MAG: DUF6159 family protein [Myxococcota bacterium]